MRSILGFRFTVAAAPGYEAGEKASENQKRRSQFVNHFHFFPGIALD
jgi:hypothetical protein